MKKLATIASALIIYFISTTQALAQAEITIKPVIGFSTLSQAINTLVSAAMFGGALLTFGYLIFGAFKYVTAQDDAAKTAAARKTMQNAVIGLILLGLIVVIFQIVIRIIPGLDQWFGSGGSGGTGGCSGWGCATDR